MSTGEVSNLQRTVSAPAREDISKTSKNQQILIIITDRRTSTLKILQLFAQALCVLIRLGPPMPVDSGEQVKVVPCHWARV